MKRLLLFKAVLVIGALYLASSSMVFGAMGQALYERWEDDGTVDSMLTETSSPDYTEIITSSEWGVGDVESLNYYRGRITAWLVPPVTGKYTFWIVTDDYGRLWLSTDHDTANAVLIAEETGWAGEEDWADFGDEARSASITLQAGKAYWLRGAYQEFSGDDHIRIGWACNEAGIADHTIIEGQYLSDTDPFYASFPIPADGAVNVKVENVQLSWIGPALLPEATYNVYLGSDPNEELPMLASSLEEPTVNAGNLETETTYVWRVDVLDPNEGGNPIINQGPVWSFTTTPAKPVIFVQPQHSLVFAGETANFTISAYSANSVPMTYKWFKDIEPTVTLSDTDTLLVPDAQLDDEGMYKCTLSNEFGSVTSDAAGLFIKRALGHWPFDESLEDVIGGNEGTYTGGGSEAYGTGVPTLGNALEFDGTEGKAVTIPTTAVKSGFWSIAFWDFSPGEVLNMGYMVSCGSPEGYETLLMRRWEDSWIGGLNRYVGAVGGITVEWESEEAFGYLGPYERDQWHYHVMAHNPVTGIATWYIDGVMAGEYTDAEFTAFEPEIYIGNSDGGGRAFEGLIDDLWIYSYPLDPIEVAVNYTTVSGTEICVQYPDYDFNQDCKVEIEDILELMELWLECNLYPADFCL